MTNEGKTYPMPEHTDASDILGHPFPQTNPATATNLGAPGWTMAEAEEVAAADPDRFALDLGPAVEAAARAYAADMGLSLALCAPEAADRLRRQVYVWLTAAVPYIVAPVADEAKRRGWAEGWHARAADEVGP